MPGSILITLSGLGVDMASKKKKYFARGLNYGPKYGLFCSGWIGRVGIVKSFGIGVSLQILLEVVFDVTTVTSSSSSFSWLQVLGLCLVSPSDGIPYGLRLGITNE